MFDFNSNDIITIVIAGLVGGAISIFNYIAKKTTNTVDDKVAEKLTNWKEVAKKEVIDKIKK